MTGGHRVEIELNIFLAIQLITLEYLAMGIFNRDSDQRLLSIDGQYAFGTQPVLCMHHGWFFD